MAKVGIFNEISKFLSKKSPKKVNPVVFLLSLHQITI